MALLVNSLLHGNGDCPRRMAWHDGIDFKVICNKTANVIGAMRHVGDCVSRSFQAFQNRNGVFAVMGLPGADLKAQGSAQRVNTGVDFAASRRLPRNRLSGSGSARLWIARSEGGIATRIHAAVDAPGLPIRFAITPGQWGDCPQARGLIKCFCKSAIGVRFVKAECGLRQV